MDAAGYKGFTISFPVEKFNSYLDYRDVRQLDIIVNLLTPGSVDISQKSAKPTDLIASGES